MFEHYPMNTGRLYWLLVLTAKPSPIPRGCVNSTKQKIMIDQVSAHYKGLIPRVKGILARLAGHAQEYLMNVRLFCSYRTSI